MIAKVTVWIKQILLILWLVFMFALGMLILSENEARVNVSLILFELESLPVGVLISGVLAVGVLLGFMTSFFVSGGRVWLQKERYKRVNRELQKFKVERAS